MATTQERGWPGHFILADRCKFRRNTLVTEGERRIVVSTVGGLLSGDTVGSGRYFETMAFEAALDPDGYWDADVSRQVSLDVRCAIDHYEASADREANEMHDAAVAAAVAMVTTH